MGTSFPHSAKILDFVGIKFHDFETSFASIKSCEERKKQFFNEIKMNT